MLFSPLQSSVVNCEIKNPETDLLKISYQLNLYLSKSEYRIFVSESVKYNIILLETETNSEENVSFLFLI